MRFDIPENWTFRDPDVARGFDSHVREQLPWYDLATQLTAHVVRHYLPDRGRVYDIGASTGNIGRSIAQILADRSAEIIPIEPSREMAELYDGPGVVQVADACEFEFRRFDVAVMFLSMMFIPTSKRPGLIQTLKTLARPGGAIIVVDKCVPIGGYPASVMMRLAIAEKVRMGVPMDEVMAKELSLSGVQRPIDPSILGDGAVEFFRVGDFAGWILESPQVSHG